MPMYDYFCRDCQTEFIAIVPLSRRDEPQVCPQCQSNDSERIVSLPASAQSGVSGYSSNSGCGGGGRFT